jgi:Zn-dependent protease with chaperone function
MGTVADPSGKPFGVFRAAIRGSVSGIAENASPAEIQAALRNAQASELKALGYRALRGVLGHEFTHVMNRDMIIGATAGATSSAIAFSSYGVLWAVGHAKAAVKKLKEYLLNRTVDVQPAKKGLLSGKDRASVEPEMLVEPVTAGAAVKTALGLLRIFAALWGPIIATILQMASSRVREGAADEGGALRTNDPAALALGLGLLTTWQPPAGFVVRPENLPRIASQAHLMTVNPIEQLYRAGALPELDSLTRMAVGSEDNFFFNLFITHPDTTLRIERLYDMQKAIESGAK